MKNEVIGVDTLKLKSVAKPQSTPMQISKIALQVNDLVNELVRLTAINAKLIEQIKELRKNA